MFKVVVVIDGVDVIEDLRDSILPEAIFVLGDAKFFFLGVSSSFKVVLVVIEGVIVIEDLRDSTVSKVVVVQTFFLGIRASLVIEGVGVIEDSRDALTLLFT